MDLNLLSPNLVVFLSLIFGVGFMTIAFYADKSWRKIKYFNPKTVAVLIISILLAVAIQLTVQNLYPKQQLPAIWIMSLPFTMALGLLVPAWANKKHWLKGFSLLTVICGFLFSFVLVNNYYSFYPTLYSVFGADTKSLLSIENTSSPEKDPKSSTKSIESELYGKNNLDGVVTSLRIPGQVSKFKPQQEWLYTPAIARIEPQIKLPVMVLIPGSPGMPFNWLTADLKHTVDVFALHHHGIAPYVFMVDDTGSVTNDTECVDSPIGHVETYLSVDVPNYIKQHYNVETAPQHWAIGGLSMGGMCSVMLTLRHPNVYRSFLDFGGDIGPAIGTKLQTIKGLFGGSVEAWNEHQPTWLLQHNDYKSYHLAGYFAIGKGDDANLIKNMGTLYKITKAHGFDVTFAETNGQHTFTEEGQSFKAALPWISHRLGAT